MNPNAELAIRALEELRAIDHTHMPASACDAAIQWVREVAALAEQPAHTDHGRNWDRTCPACAASQEKLHD